MCWGIALDYKKAFINARIEAVCIHSRVDNNCFAQKTDAANVTASITVIKVQLHSPLIDPTPVHKLELIRTIEAENDIHVLFRGEKLIKSPHMDQCTSIGSYNHHLLQKSASVYYTSILYK